MKKLMLIAVGLAASMACALAQETGGALSPSSLNPKVVEPQRAPAISTQLPRSPRPNPEGDKPINPDEPNLTIKGIIVVKSRADIKEGGVPATTGVHVQDIPFLEHPDFEQALQPFLGKLLTENRVRDLEDAVILYCRQRGKLLVDVILPEQNIENGVLQLWFLEGKVGKITVDNPGRKWFSDKLILDDVRLRPGGEVNSKKLTEDLDWLNNNPFRQVNVSFKPGDKLGLTDVQLQVNDRIPIRPYLGYENSGTRYTGVDRFLFGVNWGNAFGLGQQLNYQYLTDVNFNLVSAHSGSYIIPLPWRHTLMLYGAYVDGKADFGKNSPTANGISWQASMRYSIPLPSFAKSRQQVTAGFDFKRSDNNLQFGGTNILQTSDTDVAQFMLGYSDVTPDPYGQTSVGLELFYSPGGLTQYNDNKDYNLLRARAKADYFYGRLNVERFTRLPGGFTWVLNGWGQWANNRLLPSEELALGGYDTVRGYDERVVTGDNGWIISNELRTPPIQFLREVFHVQSVEDQMQFLAFCDYGAVRLVDPQKDDGLNPDRNLVGVGAGMRWMIARNFSFRFDYGFPLTNKSINKHDSRANVGLLLSF